MNSVYIGLAARLSGTTIKAIRHYENIGLIPPAQRLGKYRVYGEESIEILRFIKCAQQLGFKLKELENILGEYDGKNFPWDAVLKEIEGKKKELLFQVDNMQKLYDGLQSFENNILSAKGQCHYEARKSTVNRIEEESMVTS